MIRVFVLFLFLGCLLAAAGALGYVWAAVISSLRRARRDDLMAVADAVCDQQLTDDAFAAIKATNPDLVALDLVMADLYCTEEDQS